MSYKQVCKKLVGDNPGRSTELNYYRVGPDKAAIKVYLQAAIHADEQPGILVLHHLLDMLIKADEAGQLNARFVIFPMVNPLGMGDIEFERHQGRYNRASGINHNRQWPNIFESLDQGFIKNLGDDAKQNIDITRKAIRRWAAALPDNNAHRQWQKLVISEACDADYVFDLHCDDDSLIHIFSIPQLQENMQKLAGWTGAAATLLAEDSGGNSFDEVWPAVWLKLAREVDGKPIPLPVKSCTLEYRGQADTFDALNHRDAENLFAYFQAEGLIAGKPGVKKKRVAKATDLRATQYLRAPEAGLLIYRVALGDKVQKGQPIADLLRLHGNNAFRERIPVCAGTDGIVLSRATNKYVWRNAQVGKIVGSEILDSGGEFLLGD